MNCSRRLPPTRFSFFRRATCLSEVDLSGEGRKRKVRNGSCHLDSPSVFTKLSSAASGSRVQASWPAARVLLPVCHSVMSQQASVTQPVRGRGHLRRLRGKGERCEGSLAGSILQGQLLHFQFRCIPPSPPCTSSGQSWLFWLVYLRGSAGWAGPKPNYLGSVEKLVLPAPFCPA